jgi:L-lactate dehydrogenase complex protein LldG
MSATTAPSAIIESSALIELFTQRAQAVSAQVQRVATKQLALELVIQLLKQEGVEDKPDSHAVWAASPIVGSAEKQQLQQAVPGIKFDVEITRDLASNAKVGISQMDWAIANTGTVVQDAVAIDTRMVSMLPILHIAFVSTKAIVPDLPALLKLVDPAKSAYITFISGPSRTADIERVLTIGVHGPERLTIILVDDLEVAA